jgi:hypothetical protein
MDISSYEFMKAIAEYTSAISEQMKELEKAMEAAGVSTTTPKGTTVKEAEKKESVSLFDAKIGKLGEASLLANSFMAENIATAGLYLSLAIFSDGISLDEHSEVLKKFKANVIDKGKSLLKTINNSMIKLG